MFAYAPTVALLFIYCGAAKSASVANDDVTYFLYNKQTGPNNPIAFHLSNVKSINLDPSKPLKFLSHGWMDDISSSWYALAVEEYLNGQDVNVIAIEWPASTGYSTAVGAAKETAVINAKVIKELVDKFGVNLANIHLIGHSLGAHIFGITGQEVLSLTGGLVGRITGLDPAGPSFNGKSADQRLSEDDAIFVDAIHTDGSGLGYGDRLADADYYPNGGVSTQPGCSGLGCSHNRAPIYFVESINNKQFIARECSSKSLFSRGLCDSNVAVVVGENYANTISGAFYYSTNTKSPFALALSGL